MDDLIDLIECFKEKARRIKYIGEPDSESINFEKDFENIVKYYFFRFNPSELYNTFLEYFRQKNLPYINIKRGQRGFYRARIGYKSVLDVKGDSLYDFNIPYYRDDINSPPPVLASAGRFNHEGTSYLYLANNINTCIAEIHLQVGQKCSIAEFECKKDITLIDFTNTENDIGMKCLNKLLTEPIHSEVTHKYNITRFLADVFKGLNDYGLYFKSSQSNGYNIVCFQTDCFKPIEYSSNIYIAKDITYSYDIMEDSVYDYFREGFRDIRKLEGKGYYEKIYLENWIKHRYKYSEEIDECTAYSFIKKVKSVYAHAQRIGYDNIVLAIDTDMKKTYYINDTKKGFQCDDFDFCFEDLDSIAEILFNEKMVGKPIEIRIE